MILALPRKLKVPPSSFNLILVEPAGKSTKWYCPEQRKRKIILIDYLNLLSFPHVNIEVSFS